MNLKCPKCGSKNISNVTNFSLDIVAKCDDCGYENFIKNFECNYKCSECERLFKNIEKFYEQFKYYLSIIENHRKNK